MLLLLSSEALLPLESRFGVDEDVAARDAVGGVDVGVGRDAASHLLLGGGEVVELLLERFVRKEGWIKNKQNKLFNTAAMSMGCVLLLQSHFRLVF